MTRALAIILALSVTSAHAQVLSDQAMKALERAAEAWRVCPSTGCTQSRSELSDGTVLIWARVLCPPPAFPVDKSDKGPPDKCLTQTEVEKDIQRAGRQGDGLAVKRGTR